MAVWNGGENRGLFRTILCPFNECWTLERCWGLRNKTHSTLRGHLPSGVSRNSIRDSRQRSKPQYKCKNGALAHLLAPALWEADGDCSHEIKRFLLLGGKAVTNLDSVLKSRDVTLPTKVCLIKAMVFPVVMHGCESWTIKKAEHRRIDAFELWCWRRLLRVPWTARRSNQSTLKEISLGCSLEGLILKLKLQYFGHLIRRADSFEKTLMLGKIEGRRRRG